MTPDERMLALLAQTGLTGLSAEQAWQQAVHLSPLLGRLFCAFQENPISAFTAAVRLIQGVARELEDTDGDIVALLEKAREAERDVRRRIASGLEELQTDYMLRGAPALASLAQAAKDVAEAWAEPQGTEPENDPFSRAREATGALITAVLLQEGKDTLDREERQRVAKRLAARLRGICFGQ